MRALDLIRLHAKNFICDGTTFGPEAHKLLFSSLRGENLDPRDPKLYNEGFPFRIWRETGLHHVTGRGGESIVLDGQASCAENAVDFAGNDGIITTCEP